MEESLLLDELLVTLRIPAGLSDADSEAIRRTLTAAEFLPRLHRAARTVVNSYPELTRVRVTVSR